METKLFNFVFTVKLKGHMVIIVLNLSARGLSQTLPLLSAGSTWLCLVLREYSSASCRLLHQSLISSTHSLVGQRSLQMNQCQLCSKSVGFGFRAFLRSDFTTSMQFQSTKQSVRPISYLPRITTVAPGKLLLVQCLTKSFATQSCSR